ncbi:rod shape-determining protein [Helicobacter burdigaliensis]|uniref:rod shape-determining protein n=1 Tax=Helicobacter burdigaliensis TaxID=2315334 RepID=UPI000EF6D309|nr:rod shape-determining protein [Helicobacter burdigaliensis]
MAILNRSDIAIDLGTVNTILRNDIDNVVFNEATCIALDCRFGAKRIVAVGNQAKKMLGRAPKDYLVINPLLNGAISDFETTKIFMKNLIERSKVGTLSPRVGISIPQNLTQVERYSLYEATISAGAKEVLLIEDPFSASVGAGVDISTPRATMVIDAGGGVIEVSIISLGGLVTSSYSKEGGDHLNNILVEHFRHNKNIAISKEIAEDIKHKIKLLEDNLPINISAKDLVSGLPSLFEVDMQELRNLLLKEILKIKQIVLEAIHNTPPQIAPDIIDDGAILTGGMALMSGFKEILEEELKMKIRLSPDPILDISKGAALIMQSYERYAQKL